MLMLFKAATANQQFSKSLQQRVVNLPVCVFLVSHAITPREILAPWYRSQVTQTVLERTLWKMAGGVIRSKLANPGMRPRQFGKRHPSLHQYFSG
jgi:hypothetical protein